MNLQCIPEFGQVLYNKRTRLTISARLTAPELSEDESARPIVSLTAVLDKSSSMFGRKLALVKKSTVFLLDQLSKRDKLGVVVYDKAAEEVIQLSQTTEGFKGQARRVIKDIRSGVQQQLDAEYIRWDDAVYEQNPEDDVEDDMYNHFEDFLDGMVRAPRSDPLPLSGLFALGAPSMSTRSLSLNSAELAKLKDMLSSPPPKKTSPAHTLTLVSNDSSRRAPHTMHPVEDDAVRCVFLFTDGVANHGTQQLTVLQSLLDSNDRNVRVHTIGYGWDHSPDVLTQIAEAGRGTYYYIDKEDNIPSVFAEALGGLLSVSAQNVEVTFTPAPGVSVRKVHSRFPSKKGAQQAGVSISVGDFCAEETKDILIDVELPETDGPLDRFEIGKLSLSYLDVRDARMKEEEIACFVRRNLCSEEDFGSGDVYVAAQRARVHTASALHEARKLADAGSHLAAQARIQSAVDMLQDVRGRVVANSKEAMMVDTLLADLLDAFRNVNDRETYLISGSSASMMAKMWSHSFQTNNSFTVSVDGDSLSSYNSCNSMQASLREKVKDFFSSA